MWRLHLYLSLIHIYLYDKFFVEYHTKADQHVLLNYSVNGGEYHKEEIPEVYDGIYVKAVSYTHLDVYKRQVQQRGRVQDPGRWHGSRRDLCGSFSKGSDCLLYTSRCV